MRYSSRQVSPFRFHIAWASLRRRFPRHRPRRSSRRIVEYARILWQCPSVVEPWDGCRDSCRPLRPTSSRSVCVQPSRKRNTVEQQQKRRTLGKRTSWFRFKSHKTTDTLTAGQIFLRGRFPIPTSIDRVETTLCSADHGPIGRHRHVIQWSERFSAACYFVPRDQFMKSIIIDPCVPFAIDTKLAEGSEWRWTVEDPFCSYLCIRQQETIRMFVFASEIELWETFAEQSNKLHHFFMPRNIGHRQTTGTRITTIGHTLEESPFRSFSPRSEEAELTFTSMKSGSPSSTNFAYCSISSVL